MKRTKKLLILALLVCVFTALFVLAARADLEDPEKAGWYQSGGDWYYSATGDKWAEGWMKIKGYWYYFDYDNCNMATGKYECEKPDPASGIAVHDDYYYFGTDGKLRTNTWVQETYDWGDGPETDWHYYTSSGREASGWTKIGGYWYYFEPCDYESDNPEYYFRYMAYGWWRIREYYGGQARWVMYIFGLSSGKLLSNAWQKEDDAWYYATASGRAARGWQKVGSYWYYFEPEDGYMYSDCYGAPCYTWADADGDGWWYYNSDDAGENDESVFGGWYAFDEKGRMQANYWHKYYWSDFWEYYGADGRQVESGWTKIGGSWYYFEDYHMQTGVLEDGGKYYYLADSGKMLASCWHLTPNGWIYLKSNGAMAQGFTTVGTKTYFFMKSSQYGYIMRTGLQDIGDKYYYFDENGAMYRNKWFTAYGNWYYATGDGSPASGWLKIGTKWFYFVPDYHNAMAADETLEIDGVTYIFDENGGYRKA